jgi:trk system potassium uptake protein TrkA
MKSVLLIGLGRFGRHMAIKLQELGHEVLAVDKNEARVNAALSYVTDAQIGDATDEAFIKTLGVRNFDLCVVAVGEDFESSLEATSLLKDNGAKFVLSRSATDVHAKFLLRNGADDVIYPASQAARYAAVRYTTDNVLDYMALSDDYSICEISVPAEWVNHSILQLSIRAKYNISIMAIKENSQMDSMPDPNYVFHGNETLLVLGRNNDLQRFLK